ncbi:class I SAM-dependent methyltransferase [Magnetospirillum sp. SS-4]|uniref:class I SAM-dependent methyltransferase n=1 Tax=Magnetospirillum sp. SS-4 TaxID=2681465 RepID=UPI001380C7CA|nr:class I SAM-dependent methyltransferase [Magnetospirillum sp. SS-4]CAA7623888.1 putative methyltransferase [Magnetospirillum sp. SS-4]
MKTEWDYTDLADAYLKRPDYSDAAIDAMLRLAGLSAGAVCDVGAGVAHLTLMLAARGFDVTAVEPNDSMRANGIRRTADLAHVRWFEGTGEHTGQADRAFDLVTFGSSFNVCDRAQALRETARILKPGGWFACMWNHRRLDDPIQSRIEDIIRRAVPAYGYGTRREDQKAVIEASGLFGPVVHLDAGVVHEQGLGECVEAWRSHATLARQAGDAFAEVVAAIDAYLRGLGQPSIMIPYDTNIWIAQLK